MKNERKIKMTFDYNTLKRAARDGSRLGNWNGKAVFAASAADLENRGNGAFYVLYDDENKLVTKINGAWKSYGEVSTAGSVHEYSGVRNYKIPAVAQVKSAAMPQAGGFYSPGYDRAERPVGDVKTEIDVEKTLKMAREMTIEDLLEGFLPGVDFSVEKG
jgi:hypothetical protein